MKYEYFTHKYEIILTLACPRMRIHVDRSCRAYGRPDTGRSCALEYDANTRYIPIRIYIYRKRERMGWGEREERIGLDG